jgi:MFS family permease
MEEEDDLATHSLFTALKNLKGNARGAVFTEPLWGIPFQLYAPYVSVYMLSFGMKDSQIGLLITIGMACQVLMSLLSGAITDKLGRKRTTLIFDILSWSVPTLIWAIAQNFTYFLVAAVINSMWRITMNSWTCLLVEDTDPDQLVDIYAWIYISGLLVAFVAPVAGLLVNAFSLVPTVRGLYLFAAVMMTAKFVVMNFLVTETRQGLVRMQESRHQSLFALLGEYRGVLGQVLRAPQTLYTLGIMLVMSICMMVNNTFWSILVTEKLRIPAEHLSLYATARSVTMLLFFFFVLPRVRWLHFKIPMIVGFGGFVLSQLLLITAPERGYLWLLVSLVLEACSVATVNPQIDRMVAVTIEPKERARILAILYVVMIVLTSPFGWLAGALSELNRILPFLLNMLLFAAGALLVYLTARRQGKQDRAEEPAEPVSISEQPEATV